MKPDNQPAVANGSESKNEHIGSSLDELLADDGALAEVTQIARQRVADYERALADEQKRRAVHVAPLFKRVAGG